MLGIVVIPVISVAVFGGIHRLEREGQTVELKLIIKSRNFSCMPVVIPHKWMNDTILTCFERSKDHPFIEKYLLIKNHNCLCQPTWPSPNRRVGQGCPGRRKIWEKGNICGWTVEMWTYNQHRNDQRNSGGTLQQKFNLIVGVTIMFMMTWICTLSCMINACS